MKNDHNYGFLKPEDYITTSSSSITLQVKVENFISYLKEQTNQFLSKRFLERQ